MKRILSLFAICLLFVSVYSQDNTIPKKANTIIISGDLPMDQYFSKINDLLFENGYGILNADKDLGSITTTDKSFNKGVIKLVFLIKDQKVLLRGQYNMNISIDMGGVTSEIGWTEIMYYGMKKSPNIIAWDEMLKIADAIPGTKTYKAN